MATGTRFRLACPKCKRGMWMREPADNGVRATGQVEVKVSKSNHKGYGNGGQTFRGHRGIVKCGDCGHAWASTHPSSGRVSTDQCTKPCCV